MLQWPTFSVLQNRTECTQMQTCMSTMLLDAPILQKDKTKFLPVPPLNVFRNLSCSCGKEHCFKKTTQLSSNDGCNCAGLPVQHETSDIPKVARCGYGSGQSHIVKGPFCCCIPLSVYFACRCNDRDICSTTTAAATLSLSVSLCLFVLQALKSLRLLLHTMATISSSLCCFVCSSLWVTTMKMTA